MAETVTIASRAPIKLQIRSRPKSPDRPGLEPLPKTHDLAPSRHPEHPGVVGVTRGVDAQIFREWMEDHPEHRGVLWEMPEAGPERGV